MVPSNGSRPRWLNKLAESMRIHVLTADTVGKAQAELKGINCEIHILTGENHDVQKEEFVTKLVAENVVAFGNGNNDRRMLKAARIGVALCLAEGCAVDTITPPISRLPHQWTASISC
jgi:soluble P-type ATPase